MQEIVSGIWIWSSFSEEKGLDFNGFFVRGPEDAVIVDPPPCQEDDLGLIKRLGKPESILITNRHHVRSSRELAAHFEIPIRIHEADAPLIDFTPGGTFRDGDRLPAGLMAISVPDGKSPGETALYVSWAKTLILGDALIGNPAGKLSMLPASKYRDPLKARESLKRLLEYSFETILVGDGVSIPQRGKKALQEFLSRPSAS